MTIYTCARVHFLAQRNESKYRVNVALPFDLSCSREIAGCEKTVCQGGGRLYKPSSSFESHRVLGLFYIVIAVKFITSTGMFYIVITVKFVTSNGMFYIVITVKFLTSTLDKTVQPFPVSR